MAITRLFVVILIVLLPYTVAYLTLDFQASCFSQVSDGLFVSCDDSLFTVVSFLYDDGDTNAHDSVIGPITETVEIGQNQPTTEDLKRFAAFNETLACCKRYPAVLDPVATRDIFVHAAPAIHRWTVQELLSFMHAGVDPWLEALQEDPSLYYSLSISPSTSGSAKSLITLNGLNEVVFAAITGDLIRNPENVLAVAFFYIDHNVTRILEWNVAVNLHRLSSFFDLEQNPRQRGFDFATLLRHEFGHTFGLGHAVECTLSVMYPSLSRQEIRALIVTDKQCMRTQHGLPINVGTINTFSFLLLYACVIFFVC